MAPQQELKEMARLAQEAMELAATGQKAALSVLLAEMRALAALLPVGETGPESAAQEAERRRLHEAEVEAGFDNMPV